MSSPGSTSTTTNDLSIALIVVGNQRIDLAPLTTLACDYGVEFQCDEWTAIEPEIVERAPLETRTAIAEYAHGTMCVAMIVGPPVNAEGYLDHAAATLAASHAILVNLESLAVVTPETPPSHAAPTHRTIEEAPMTASELFGVQPISVPPSLNMVGAAARAVLSVARQHLAGIFILAFIGAIVSLWPSVSIPWLFAYDAVLAFFVAYAARAIAKRENPARTPGSDGLLTAGLFAGFALMFSDVTWISPDGNAIAVSGGSFVAWAIGLAIAALALATIGSEQRTAGERVREMNRNSYATVRSMPGAFVTILLVSTILSVPFMLMFGEIATGLAFAEGIALPWLVAWLLVTPPTTTSE